MKAVLDKVAACSELYTKHVNMLCVQSVEFLNAINLAHEITARH